MRKCPSKIGFAIALALLLVIAPEVPADTVPATAPITESFRGQSRRASTRPSTRPTTRRASTRSTSRPARQTRGEVLRLDKNSITANPYLPERINEGISGPKTYTIDDQTRIVVGRVIDERTTATGQRVQNIRLEPGTRDDLKVGQRVKIEADGDKAIEIAIFPDPPTPPEKKPSEDKPSETKPPENKSPENSSPEKSSTETNPPTTNAPDSKKQD